MLQFSPFFRNVEKWLNILSKKFDFLGIPDFLSMFDHFSALRRKWLIYPYSFFTLLQDFMSR